MPKKVYRHLHTTYNSPAFDPNLLTPQNFGGLEIASTYLNYRDGLESNNSSVVISLTYCGTQIIVPGDIEGTAVTELIQNGQLPDLIGTNRILIAPHHGRESADPSALLQYYSPNLVLASAKEEDEFTDTQFSSANKVGGHPISHSNGEIINHRFMATKGEAFHININPLVPGFPFVKRVAYK